MLKKAKKSPKSKPKAKHTPAPKKPEKVEMITKSAADVELWEKVQDDWDIVDVDKDGKLKKEEVKEYVEKYFQDRLEIKEANKVVHELFEQIDANHDSIVTLREMYEYMRKGKKQGDLGDEKEEGDEKSEEEAEEASEG